jgi:hypothetical protein
MSNLVVRKETARLYRLKGLITIKYLRFPVSDRQAKERTMVRRRQIIEAGVSFLDQAFER